MNRVIVLLYILLAHLMIGSTTVRGAEVEVSLLTCSPGVKSYELYGHTALRVKQIESGIDAVFNYGVFDYTQSNFTWHFILGKCDYMVMPVSYDAFFREYERRGSSILSQRLNLTQGEAVKLFGLLYENAKPENMVYHYDFYRNNCTTKVRDIVEQAVDGEIIYPELPLLLMYHRHETYREMIHYYTSHSKWCEAGQDLLLGCHSDTVLSSRAMLFLPECLSSAYDGAEIRSENKDTRPLVAERKELLQKGCQIDEPGFPFSPLQCSVILFAFSLLVLTLEVFFKRQMWLVDIVLWGAVGVAGLLLCFLFCFSKHPTLDSNFQIWLFNPLPLVGLFYIVPAARKKQRTLWHGFDFAWLFFFILFMPWVPQDYASGVFPLALSLMTRPISYFLAYRRDEQ